MMGPAVTIAEYFRERGYGNAIIIRTLLDQNLPDLAEALVWLCEHPRDPKRKERTIVVEPELDTGSPELWTRLTPGLRRLQNGLDRSMELVREQNRLLANVLEAQQMLIELDRVERERLTRAKADGDSAA